MNAFNYNIKISPIAFIISLHYILFLNYKLLNMGAIGDTIRNRDIFGHVANLGFNKKGNLHRTLIGGICSFIAYMILMIYFGWNTYKMFRYADDKIG